MDANVKFAFHSRCLVKNVTVYKTGMGMMG